MRCLLPRTLRIAAALSSAACLVSVALFWRSIYVGDEVRTNITTNDRCLAFSSAHGRVLIFGAHVFPDGDGWSYENWSEGPIKHWRWQWLWFTWRDESRFSGTGSIFSNPVLGVPYWACTIVFGALPARQLMAWRRRIRRPTGVCSSCGYDLRASLGRCPECGALPAEQEP